MKDELLRRLKNLRGSFGDNVATEKVSIMRILSKTTFLKPSELLAYHDLLCFLRAFPNNSIVASLAERELRSFGRRVDEYKRLSRDKQGRRLANSGLPHTVTTHPFSYEMIRRLLSCYPGTLAIDDDADNYKIMSKVQDFFPFVIVWQENDAWENDDDFDIDSWMKMAQGGKTSGRLQFLVQLLAASGLAVEFQRYFYDDLDIPVAWKLGDLPASRTRTRLPSKRKFFQQTPLRGRTSDLRAELAKPATPLNLLPVRTAQKYIHAVNDAMAVRNRELYPLTFANPAEVYTVNPGRGLQIAIFGMYPEVRLPLESNFGALLVRNGMPVGYGVAATLFDRVEIAINTFPAFRGGESSFAIEQFFRLFYHHFGSRAFVVRRTQMGYDDEEALHSGSFWFYYKLGFRSVNRRIRRLADTEFENIKRRPGYRTPIKMMKRLAKGDVFFHSDPGRMNDWHELSVVDMGYAITRFFSEKYDGNREHGLRMSFSRVSKTLNIRHAERWSKDEMTALERMAPMLDGIDDLAKWTGSEKANLAGIIRGKGGRHERDYVLRCNRHPKLYLALENIARTYRDSKAT